MNDLWWIWFILAGVLFGGGVRTCYFLATGRDIPILKSGPEVKRLRAEADRIESANRTLCLNSTNKESFRVTILNAAAKEWGIGEAEYRAGNMAHAEWHRGKAKGLRDAIDMFQTVSWWGLTNERG